jgi:hypothetical protein
MADSVLCIFGHQSFQLSLGFFVLEIGRLSPGKDCGEIRPGIGGAHIDNANRIHARSRRLDPKQGRGLATLDAAPELAFGGDNEVLVQRIGMGGDFHPFATASDNRQDR